jgi:hypothetical protein
MSGPYHEYGQGKSWLLAGQLVGIWRLRLTTVFHWVKIAIEFPQIENFYRATLDEWRCRSQDLEGLMIFPLIGSD